MTFACLYFSHNQYKELIQMPPNQKIVNHFVDESESHSVSVVRFVHCDTPPVFTCHGWGNEHKLLAILADGQESVSYIESLLSDTGDLRTGDTSAGPFRAYCSNSIVFCETTLDLIHVCFPLLLSDPVSPLSLFSLHRAGLSIQTLPLVCMCAYQPVTGMEKPQIEMRQRFNEFLCCFMALRGLHGVMGFI